jgi:hypothetical protein
MHLVGILYKYYHAPLFDTLSHPHFKTPKTVKKCFIRTSLKNPTCFGHYYMTILRGRPFCLVHYHFSACLLRHLPIRYVVVGRLCVCVSGVPVCGLSGRPDNPQTATPDTYTNRRHRATYWIGKWWSKQAEKW